MLSDSPSGLQGALDILSHYAKRYQLKFNAGKTKIVVTGSKVDMAFYKDTSPWTINGEKISVVDSNEHLGLKVSGTDEERRNVDENIMIDEEIENKANSVPEVDGICSFDDDLGSSGSDSRSEINSSKKASRSSSGSPVPLLQRSDVVLI